MYYVLGVAFTLSPSKPVFGGDSLRSPGTANVATIQIADQVTIGTPTADISAAIDRANIATAGNVDRRGDVPGLPSVIVFSAKDNEMVYAGSCDHDLMDRARVNILLKCTEGMTGEDLAFLAAQKPGYFTRLYKRNSELVKERDDNLHAFQKLTGSSANERMKLFAMLAEAKALLLLAMAESASDDAIEPLVRRIGEVVPEEHREKTFAPASHHSYDQLPLRHSSAVAEWSMERRGSNACCIR